MPTENLAPDNGRPLTSEGTVRKWLKIFSLMFGKEIDKTLEKIYQQALVDFTSEQIEQCCKECLLESKFMPTVAEIRGKLARRGALVASGLAEQDWISAWAASGRDSKCELSDAGQYALRLIGGWETLFSVNALKSESFLRKEFIEAHGRYQERERLGISDGDAKRLLQSVSEVKKLTDVNASEIAKSSR